MDGLRSWVAGWGGGGLWGGMGWGLGVGVWCLVEGRWGVGRWVGGWVGQLAKGEDGWMGGYGDGSGCGSSSVWAAGEGWGVRGWRRGGGRGGEEEDGLGRGGAGREGAGLSWMSGWGELEGSGQFELMFLSGLTTGKFTLCSVCSYSGIEVRWHGLLSVSALLKRWGCGGRCDGGRG